MYGIIHYQNQHRQDVVTVECRDLAEYETHLKMACDWAERYPDEDRAVWGEVLETHEACADCGSSGHDTGSNTCPGPDEQDRLLLSEATR